MTHKQYGLIFLLATMIAVIWAMSARYIVVCAVMCWLAVSFAWVATAFFLHCPEMLMGKRQHVKAFLPFCIINLPFLILYWLTWLVRHFVFPHNPVNAIDGTYVSVSCWPGFHVPLDQYDVIIDVTSEMPRWYQTGSAKYVCLPNLDGVPLDRSVLPLEIDREMRILVHCAQGRGRSALMTCIILLKLGYATTANDALQILKQSRPSVSISRHQLSQLEYFARNNMFGCSVASSE